MHFLDVLTFRCLLLATVAATDLDPPKRRIFQAQNGISSVKENSKRLNHKIQSPWRELYGILASKLNDRIAFQRS
jgi:hypothetical protein